MTKELVTTVITTYGRSFDEILPSIESVLQQTYPEIELLIIDDNGMGTEIQKNLFEKIKGLESDRVRYIANEKNSGAQVSRNKGIENSNGKFVAFLDDDDIWEANKIELQVRKFSQTGVGLVYSKGWTVFVSDNGQEISTKPYNMSESFRSEVDFRDLSYGDYIGTTSQVLILKDVFNNVGMFDIEQPARQDYEMWIRISRKYKCVGVDEYLFRHYQHPGEQISKNPDKAICGMKRIYDKYHEESSLTANWHILHLIMRSYKKANNKKMALRYTFLSGTAFLKAAIFDSGELKKRIGIHNSRK